MLQQGAHSDCLLLLNMKQDQLLHSHGEGQQDIYLVNASKYTMELFKQSHLTPLSTQVSKQSIRNIFKSSRIHHRIKTLLSDLSSSIQEDASLTDDPKPLSSSLETSGNRHHQSKHRPPSLSPLNESSV